MNYLKIVKCGVYCMSEKRFIVKELNFEDTVIEDTVTKEQYNEYGVVDLLNEQQELIEELQVSDEMGWKRAERFEKKCPKELHNKKMYIKRLEYKVQKFKEENEQLRKELKELENNYKDLLYDGGFDE